MKLALIQMESAIGGLEENVTSASRFIDEGAREGAELLVLPEFWSTGYFPLAVDYSLYDLADSEDGKATTAIKEKARQHGVHIASTIYERQAAGLFYNTSMMVNPEGEVISKYRKVHVPARRGLEKLFYRGGSKFPVARVGEWQVGTMLCYDTLLPEPARCLALNGAELILAPFGASTTEGGIWEHMIITRAFENGAYVAACNAVGDLKLPDGDGFTLGGKSIIVDPEGGIVAEAEAAGETIVYGDLELDRVNEVRTRYFMLRDRRPDAYHVITTATEDIS
jgi:predicted amidohydrolase